MWGLGTRRREGGGRRGGGKGWSLLTKEGKACMSGWSHSPSLLPRRFPLPPSNPLSPPGQASCDGWQDFVGDMQQYYGVDLGGLTPDFEEEQADYFSRTAAWCDVHPGQTLGPPACIKTYDLHSLSLEELKADLDASFKLRLLQDCTVEALAGYFDVQFRGSAENPTDSPVNLSTAPDPTGGYLGWAAGCLKAVVVGGGPQGGRGRGGSTGLQP